jgi:hypothetical protein
MARRPISLILVLLLLAVRANAEDLARLRYTTALRLASVHGTKIQSATHQYAQLSTESKLQGVSPKDIRIWIVTDEREIEIPIAENGDFTLPISEELAKRDPWSFGPSSRRRVNESGEPEKEWHGRGEKGDGGHFGGLVAWSNERLTGHGREPY